MKHVYGCIVNLKGVIMESSLFILQRNKKRILYQMDELAHRHRVSPDVTTRQMDKYGKVFIEFYDEYHHEDACFFEDLVEALGAKLCDCEEL